MGSETQSLQHRRDGYAWLAALLGLIAVWAFTAEAAQGATLIEDPTAQLPGLLSGTGLLSARGELAHERAVVFEPRWPLWSNGSAKQRHLILPKDARIDTSEADDWQFPVGTLIFKTFSFETSKGLRPIETRLLRGLESGWEFAVYEWKPDGSDAALMDISSPKPIEGTLADGSPIKHEIPSRLQCRQCHEANANFVIGFSRLNLSTEPPRSGRLREFFESGLFSHRLEDTPYADDALHSREIRGYIHGNCVHCHNGRARVDLSEDVFLANALGKSTRGFLFPAGLRIAPGRPDESLLYLAFARENRKDLAAAHMPPVGVQQPDKGMIETLRDWIASLDEKTPPPAEAPDAVSPRARLQAAERKPGFVPNRHATSAVSAHTYPLAFERIMLDGDHSDTRGFTSICFLPESNRFLLAEHEGRISLYELQGNKASRRGELRIPNVFASIECGLVSIAIDPAFTQNRFLYVGYCHRGAEDIRVARLRLDLDDFAKSVESLVPILHAGVFNSRHWHTIGSILFDPAAMMYVLLGDRGLSEPAADRMSLLGAILRIEPNRDPNGSGYTIPADNPRPGFLSRRREELVAKGLRNPWTGAFDARGRLWIGDVGERYEEIDILDPEQGFHDFGWPEQDGECLSRCGGLTNPVISYTRSGDNKYAREDPGTFPVPAQCVWVGLQYKPHAADRYRGRLENTILFGDLVLGWVRGLTLDGDGRVTADRLLGNMPGITSWAQGGDDYFYISTYAAYTQEVAGVFRAIPRE